MCELEMKPGRKWHEHNWLQFNVPAVKTQFIKCNCLQSHHTSSCPLHLIHYPPKKNLTSKSRRWVCTAPHYPIDPALQMLNPIDMYKEALITFCLSI